MFTSPVRCKNDAVALPVCFVLLFVMMDPRIRFVILVLHLFTTSCQMDLGAIAPANTAHYASGGAPLVQQCLTCTTARFSLVYLNYLVSSDKIVGRVLLERPLWRTCHESHCGSGVVHVSKLYSTSKRAVARADSERLGRSTAG